MKKGFKSAWSSLKNSKTGMFGLILVLLIIICAIFAPLLAPYDPLAQDVMIKLKDPIWGADPVAGHLLGTDQLGRDILSRLLYGARVTLIVALAGTVVGGIVGVVLGSLAGYYGKWVDAVIMRAGLQPGQCHFDRRHHQLGAIRPPGPRRDSGHQGDGVY